MVWKYWRPRMFPSLLAVFLKVEKGSLQWRLEIITSKVWKKSCQEQGELIVHRAVCYNGADTIKAKRAQLDWAARSADDGKGTVSVLQSCRAGDRVGTVQRSVDVGGTSLEGRKQGSSWSEAQWFLSFSPLIAVFPVPTCKMHPFCLSTTAGASVTSFPMSFFPSPTMVCSWKCL